MVELRQNRAKHMLQKNEPVIAVSCSDPDVVDMMGMALGLPGVWTRP